MPHTHSDPLVHLNTNHAEELLLVARAFGGHPDATAARAQHADAGGVDLVLDTPAGQTPARIDFDEAVANFPDGFRVAFVRLARAARTTVGPAAETTQP